MRAFRIYTEDLGDRALQEVIKLAGSYLEGFTVYRGQGVWRGQSEASLILEVLGDDSLGRTIQGLAAQLKEALHQEAILITEAPVTARLI